MEYNLALLKSLSNSELASAATITRSTDIPQAMARELARRLQELVDKGAIPETSEEYSDQVKELEDEVEELREVLRSISGMADSV